MEVAEGMGILCISAQDECYFVDGPFGRVWLHSPFQDYPDAVEVDVPWCGVYRQDWGLDVLLWITAGEQKKLALLELGVEPALAQDLRTSGEPDAEPTLPARDTRWVE